MVSETSLLAPNRLRAWQSAALARWHAEGRRGIAEVATGGGKTRFALACAVSIEADQPTVQVVVPTTALADQWFVSISEDVGIDPTEIAMLNSHTEPEDLRRFNIAVINTARNLNPGLWDGRRRFLIVDECHRAASPENSRSLAGDTWATLGLSATPERQYDDGLTEVLIPSLGPLIYSYGLREATEDGVLNEFALTNVRVPLSDTESDEYERLTARIAQASGRGDDERVLSLLRTRARVSSNALVRVPTAVVLIERHRGARTLVFHESIEGAEGIQSLLRSRGHSATIYHSKLGPHLRHENLRLFRRGVFDTLVTCRALDEGVNIPEVQVAVIAAATASDRQRIQRLGRVLRPSPGKDVAQVYTIYATDVEEERLLRESGSLEGLAGVTWMSAGV